MNTPRRTILALAPDLSGNSTLTAWQFRGALRRLGYDVTLAGHASGAPWTPLGAELTDAVLLRGLAGRTAGGRASSGLPARPDLVYAFKALPPSFGEGLRRARDHGVPLALHLDDWDAGFLRGRSRGRRLWWALRSWRNPNSEVWLRVFEALIPRADVLTVSSTALQRRFGGTVVPQGVDTRRFDPAVYTREEARSRLGVAESQAMVLFLGTPRRHKGLDALLSLPGLADAIWLVGLLPGAEVELGLDPRRLENVHVRPEVSYEDAAWYLAACDVFAVPQSPVPFAVHQVPAKILQAMALGAAVVATDVGDAATILGGDPPAGLVVPAEDPEALGGAIHALLRDAPRRRALGREARRRAVASYGWDAMARTLDPVLTPLVGGRAPT